MNFNIESNISLEIMSWYEFKDWYEREVSNTTEFFTVSKTYNANTTVFDFYDLFKLKNKKHINSGMVIYYDKELVIKIEGYSANPFTAQDRSLTVSYMGKLDKIKQYYDMAEEKFPVIGNSYVDWYYMSGNGIQSSTFKVVDNPVFHPEFYPFIKEGVTSFFDDFVASRANVLIILGPPGTGKTSFVRELLRHGTYSAITTYDQDVMQTDSFYISCLKSEASRKFIILEDSDILLLTREKDENRVMNKILNSSDGLVNINKKFIFTANILNSGRIDEALTRPGRCFKVLTFRHLTRKEATVVSDKLGKTLPDKDEFTLSEIFNGQAQSKVKLGF